MARTGDSRSERTRTFREICRQLGLKLTHQRLEIYSVLSSSQDHPSAEDVYQRVRLRLPIISFDTVYRTLALFERYGVIARVHHLDDRTRYDPNRKPHYHLVCTKCKGIQDFYWPDADRLPTPPEAYDWGSIENRYLELRGVCKECLKTQRETAP
jgi:Fur family peroxide stress response transcriptional regulator